ncbi:MAG: SIS domain-containing protein [Phycisphaerales bacterium]|nr:MAG: SIS domain-containing protein [Phycisphaerales bacterium]
MDQDTRKQIAQAVESHNAMVAALSESGAETIAAVADAITAAIRRNGAVYLCGNGGSAADAQHIAGELVGRFRRQRKPIPAVALSTDTSVITSIANDYSYEDVFARQVEAFVRKGDILWAFSTSGASPNVVAAARLAKERGAFVLTFTGKTGSTLERIADICLCADSESTARSQEIHQLAYHIICDLVEQSLCDQKAVEES